MDACTLEKQIKLIYEKKRNLKSTAKKSQQHHGPDVTLSTASSSSADDASLEPEEMIVPFIAMRLDN